MTYEELVETTRKRLAYADADEIRGHLAVQFNVTGEGEGAFYVEVTDGVIDVQPYEYYDRDAVIYIPGDVLYRIMIDDLTMEEAYNELMLGIEGDLGAALMLKKIKMEINTPEKEEELEETAIPEGDEALEDKPLEEDNASKE